MSLMATAYALDLYTVHLLGGSVIADTTMLTLPSWISSCNAEILCSRISESLPQLRISYGPCFCSSSESGCKALIGVLGMHMSELPSLPTWSLMIASTCCPAGDTNEKTPLLFCMSSSLLICSTCVSHSRRCNRGPSWWRPCNLLCAGPSLRNAAYWLDPQRPCNTNSEL